MLSKTLLLSYQTEYEHSTISIDELKEKYSIKLSDAQTKQWCKHDEHKPQPLLVQEPTSPIIVLPQDSAYDMGEDIELIKTNIIKEAKRWSIEDIDQAEVKEIKEMVALVDSVEKSYKPEQSGPTINILVQNMMDKFQDDC
jgi:hypothetical protein